MRRGLFPVAAQALNILSRHSRNTALCRSSRRRRRRDRGGGLSPVRGQALIVGHPGPTSASEARIPKPPLLHHSPHRRAADACALGKFVWRVVEAGGRRGSATMTALLAGGGMFVHRAAPNLGTTLD